MKFGNPVSDISLAPGSTIGLTPGATVLTSGSPIAGNFTVPTNYASGAPATNVLSWVLVAPPGAGKKLILHSIYSQNCGSGETGATAETSDRASILSTLTLTPQTASWMINTDFANLVLPTNIGITIYPTVLNTYVPGNSKGCFYSALYSIGSV